MKPAIEAQRRLIARWSCSTMLLRYDVVDWLLEGLPQHLYIVSGSTKTDEFPELLAWMNGILQSAASNSSATAKVGTRPAIVRKEELIDPLSSRHFGSRYRFTITQADGSTRMRSLVFLQDLTPVNFLFYGVPKEIIDPILAQLLSATLTLVQVGRQKVETRVYGVDYDREASLGVYGSRIPSTRFRLPLPAES